MECMCIAWQAESWPHSQQSQKDISNDIPELNHVVKNGKILALKYTEIQPYITKSIQELDVLVNNISNEINIIKKQVETIEKK